jgi:hypothetical protein
VSDYREQCTDHQQRHSYPKPDRLEVETGSIGYIVVTVSDEGHGTPLRYLLVEYLIIE